jgi:hypothetical protein
LCSASRLACVLAGWYGVLVPVSVVVESKFIAIEPCAPRELPNIADALGNGSDWIGAVVRFSWFLFNLS